MGLLMDKPLVEEVVEVKREIIPKLAAVQAPEVGR